MAQVILWDTQQRMVTQRPNKDHLGDSHIIKYRGKFYIHTGTYKGDFIFEETTPTEIT